MSRIVLFNKPFEVLSQFTDKNGRTTLKGYIDIPNVQVSGRLDRDSEGLLMLTDSGALQHKITQPKHRVSKTYWVQVEGAPQDSDLQALRDGIGLKDGTTLPARVTPMDEPYNLWARNPPIRERKHIPDTWINMTISEGRNRQVRRMCAAAGFPVLRLIRYRIGSWTLDGIQPGQYVEL